MADTERVGISVHKDTAGNIRALVEKGAYPNVSSAYEAGAKALLEQQGRAGAWWEETIRRCEEAEKHPERPLDADTFFGEVRKEIESSYKQN
jgi:Arc/MetJ-type ribon-helix-helix transcriptional regulator